MRILESMTNKHAWFYPAADRNDTPRDRSQPSVVADDTSERKVGSGHVQHSQSTETEADGCYLKIKNMLMLMRGYKW